MKDWVLDHVFVMAAPGAPSAARIADLGFEEGAPNVHPGQGTRNRRFFFENFMLELLWVHDVAEARSERTARTRLYERSLNEACPIGICIARRSADAVLPFETWPYRPAYLPEGVSIPIAVTKPDEPLVFALPGVMAAADRPVAHPSKVTRLEALELTLPTAPGAALSHLRDAGLIAISKGAPGLSIRFDGMGKAEHDIRPDLPLDLRW